MDKIDPYSRAEGIKEMLMQIRNQVADGDEVTALQIIDTYLALVDLVLKDSKSE